jgi:hypothetical protein
MAVQPVLMSFFGDNEIGSFLPGLKKAARKAVRFTPQYQAIRLARKGFKALRGDEFGIQQYSPYYGQQIYDPYMGAFLPGLTKALKKAGGAVKKTVKAVGRVTSPITTKIAKSFLPGSIVDAASAFDPTGKGSTAVARLTAAANVVTAAAAKEQAAAIMPTDTAMKFNAAGKTLTDPRFLAVAAAGVAALILISKKR